MEHDVKPTEKSPADLFLLELRTATTPMHKALEDNEISKKLMDPGVSLSDYAFYLACMGEVMKMYDEQVLPLISTVITDAEQRKKTAGIDEDLTFLYAQGMDKQPVTAMHSFSASENLSYALGYAYVIEGSTLGGRVILKHINATLGLENQGTRFFAGYGAETGTYWKNFLAGFTAYILENNTQNEAIRGAIDGFSHIGQHLAKHG
jgi:heme oxygenase